MPLFGKFHFLSLKLFAEPEKVNCSLQFFRQRVSSQDFCAYLQFSSVLIISTKMCSSPHSFHNFNLNRCVELDLDFSESVACLRVPWAGLGYILTRREGRKHCIGQQFRKYISISWNFWWNWKIVVAKLWNQNSFQQILGPSPLRYILTQGLGLAWISWHQK